MILHSPIISGSLTFADGSTFTLPDNGIYSGSYSGSFQGTTYTGGTFVGDGSQLTFGGTGIVSGSTQLTTDLDARYLNTSGEGVVSGSSQVTISGTTGYSDFSSSLDGRISTEKERVDAILLAADANTDSFAEIVSLVNSIDTTNDNAFASFYTASNAANDAQSARLTSIESVTGSYETKGRGIVSGSSQVVYASISSIPAGIVSGSSQVNLGSVSGNTTSNVIEGTNLYYTDARVKTKLTAEGVISGSSQVLGGTGIVSGSSQISLADVSGNSTSNLTEGSNLYYTDARVKTKLDVEGVISGSSQVAISSTTGFSSYSSSVDSKISTEKGRIDAILAASTADADTFAEIVTLINSVDTTNDTAFAGFVTSSNATDAAQNARLTSLESYSGSNDTANTAQNARLTSIESVTGSYETKGRGLVSGSAQITPLLPTGVVSGSSQINLGSVNGNTTSNVSEGSNLYYTDARVKTKLDAEGVISGSSQVTYASISSIPAGIVSGSAQVTSLLPGGVISGSSQLTTEFDTRYLNTLGEGIISGSSQVNLANVSGNTTTNVSEGTNLYYTDARVKTKLDAEGVISGSSQVLGGTGIISGSSQVTYASISSIPAGIVSGSSQVTSLLPAGSVSGSSQVLGGTGIVSGSSQITYASISSIPAGIVSGSTQVTSLLPSGVVSGSSQVLGGTGIVSGSSQITLGSTTGFGTYINQALLTTSDVTHNNVTISGNLTVNGTTTTVNSTTLQLGDNIIELNGSGAANGGLLVKDVTAPNTVSGSLLWDSTGDFWKAGAVGSELPLVTTSGTQTLTNKTINGSQLVDASVANAKLANSSVTVTAGTGMSGGGSVALGSTITLTNAGVTSAVAGTGVSVSGATGAVTFSIGQAVATTSAVTFASVSATGDVIAYSSSDRRLKDNIKNIENPIEKVQQLNGVTWEWNSNADELQQSLPTVGVIAQEVEEVLPQLVHDRENGYKGVDYAKLTGLLIEAIKEQQKQIDELKSKLK